MQVWRVLLIKWCIKMFKLLELHGESTLMYALMTATITQVVVRQKHTPRKVHSTIVFPGANRRAEQAVVSSHKATQKGTARLRQRP